jgi:hypothetical protein
MGEPEEPEDMRIIDYLIKENLLIYKSPPIKINVDEKDFNFEMTDKEINDATYVSDKRQIYLPFGE